MLAFWPRNDRPQPGPCPNAFHGNPRFSETRAPPSFPVARVILTLALLVGALYFAHPFEKNKMGGRPHRGAGLDVVSRVYLGPKAGLCLVRAEGRKVACGVGADGVRLLADLGSETTDTAPHA
jgi:flagellar biogenesis protein FliO